MNVWLKNTKNTWIVVDSAQHVVALVKYHPRTSLYESRRKYKKLGFYSTLVAAQQAATSLKTTHANITAKQLNPEPWNT